MYFVLYRVGGIDVLSDGECITLKATVNIKKLIYTSEEYPELKEFFDQIAEVSNTVLVFKKKS